MNAPQPLTDRQAEALRAIVKHTQLTGSPPSLRELLEALGLSPTSTNAATGLLLQLEAKGWIERDYLPTGGTKSRVLRVLHQPPPLAAARGFIVPAVSWLLCAACLLAFVAGARAHEERCDLAVDLLEHVVDGLGHCADTLRIAADADEACSCWLPPSP